MIHEKLKYELINKALEPYKITIQSILRQYPEGLMPTGKKGKTDYWYNIYSWENEEDYNTWREWALKKIGKRYTKYDLDWFEATFDLRHSYIFKKEGELF
jgi:hypothetical protein